MIWLNTSRHLALISYKHNRIVFCTEEEFNSRHKSAHFTAFYHDLTNSGKIIIRTLKLSTEGEGILWEVSQDGNFLK